MVRCQWRVVKTPPFEVVEVPLRDWKMGGDFHPMSLCLEIAVHGRILKAWYSVREIKIPMLFHEKYLNMATWQYSIGKGRQPSISMARRSIAILLLLPAKGKQLEGRQDFSTHLEQ